MQYGAPAVYARTSTATQIFTVTTGSTLIDAGNVQYDTSGDFGGYATQDESAQLTFTFSDTNHTQLGNLISTGNYLSDARNSLTGLLHDDAHGAVPSATRYVQAELMMKRVSDSVSYNGGYADNLSLVVRPPMLYLPLPMK